MIRKFMAVYIQRSTCHGKKVILMYECHFNRFIIRHILRIDGDAKRLDSIRGKWKCSGLWKIMNDTQETLTWHKSYKFGEL